MPFVLNGESHEDRLIHDEEKAIRARLEAELTADQFEQVEEGIPDLARENVLARLLVERAARDADVEVPYADVKAEFERMVAFYGGIPSFHEKFGIGEADHVRIKSGIEASLQVQRWLDGRIGEIRVTDEDLAEEHGLLRERGLHVEHLSADDVRAQLTRLAAERKRNRAVKVIKDRLRAGAELTFPPDWPWQPRHRKPNP